MVQIHVGQPILRFHFHWLSSSERMDSPPFRTVALSPVADDGVNVVVEPCRVSLADAMEFFDDRVFHGQTESNSSGVQMTGQ